MQRRVRSENNVDTDVVMALPTTLVLSILSAVLGMFQFGFNVGVINSVSVFIKEFTNETYVDDDANPTGFSEAELRSLFSVAVAAYILGGMIGALLGGYVADRFGRRRGLLYVQVFAVQGALLMGLSKYAGSFAMLGRNSIALLKSQQTFQQSF